MVERKILFGFGGSEFTLIVYGNLKQFSINDGAVTMRLMDASDRATISCQGRLFRPGRRNIYIM